MNSTRLTVCVVAALVFLPQAQAIPDEPDKAPAPTADSMRGREAGQVRDDNGLKMKLVWCPPGFVTMENVDLIAEPAALKRIQQTDDEFDAIDDTAPDPFSQPRHTTIIAPVKVFLSKGYWLGKYEVTQSEWKQVMKSEPWKGQDTTREGAGFPATFLDWNDAENFCRQLTRQEREAGRLSKAWEYTLPTEAQWECACRAGTKTRFSFGRDESQFGEYAWTVDNTVVVGEAYPHWRGLKKPNPWGLHDMHGNVWEWCRDAYADRLPGGRDPVVTGQRGSNRVLRGGGIYRTASECHSAFRHQRKADWRLYDLGLRVALSAAETR